MSNPSKRKGTDWESAIASDLQTSGFEGAARKALAGSRDEGDIHMCDTPDGAIDLEAKNCKTVTIPAWLRQADNERDNAGSWLTAVCYKLPGVGMTDPGRHPVVLRLGCFKKLVRAYLDKCAENERLKVQIEGLKERRYYV